MLSLFSQSKLNLLLIDSDELLHLRWQSGELDHIDTYCSSEEDLDRFRLFLKGDKKTPFAFILDLIEEDFRTENVPHVTGSDRKVLLARKLNNLFRNTPYKTARVIGREKEGRKDDRVLFTALTKPDFFEPWLAKLLANQVPVLAVTSAAYVMEQFAQTLGMHHAPHLLLVNHEGNSGLRQTYLQKGRVIFSRLTRAGVSRSESFEELLLEQCDQTRKYLERIKQLPYDAPLPIHIYTPEAFTDQRGMTQDLLQFHYRSVDELPHVDKINLAQQNRGAIAYSLVSVLTRRSIPNVYAPAMALRYKTIRDIGRALLSVSLVALLGTGIMAVPTFLDTKSKWEQESVLVAQTAPLLEEYDQLTERFPETPIPSVQMELVMGTNDQIAAQLVQPNEILALISEGFVASPDLRLTDISWRFEDNSASSDEEDYGGLPLDETLQVVPRAIVKGRTQLIASVAGIVESDRSFRHATEQVVILVDALRSISGYEVNAINLPINVGLDANVATTVDGGVASGEFLIEIRRDLQQ